MYLRESTQSYLACTAAQRRRRPPPAVHTYYGSGHVHTCVRLVCVGTLCLSRISREGVGLALEWSSQGRFPLVI